MFDLTYDMNSLNEVIFSYQRLNSENTFAPIFSLAYIYMIIVYIF